MTIDNTHVERYEYDPARIMEAIGNFSRLTRKMSGLLSVDELRKSQDYKEFLTLGRYLKSLNLTGQQIIELTDFYQSTITPEEIYQHPIYQDLQREYEKSRESHIKIARNSIDTIKGMLQQFEFIMPLATFADKLGKLEEIMHDLEREDR